MGFQNRSLRATRADLETLIERSRQYSARPEFSFFLSETAVDVLVRQGDPEGHVGEADAAWLVAGLSRCGGLSCAAQFEMLKRVFAAAVNIPKLLIAFAIREVELAILTGRREILCGSDNEPAVVTREDVEALRALVFAAGRLPRADRVIAEALVDIAHATGAAQNDPEFADLFAVVLSNYLAVSEDRGWLFAHLTRGGLMTRAEARLLTVLKAEAAAGCAGLRALFDQAAAKAA
jgi:hypothetical protein